MGTVPVEVEWQFDAVDLRPVERWLAARGMAGDQPAIRRLRDDYLDTTDWRLHRAGYSLRLRRTGRASEATLKSLATAHGGLRRRLELTETVAGSIAVHLNGTSGALGWRLRALAGGRELRALVQVRTTRRTFPLVLDGAEAAELALDETVIPVEGGPPARLRRVEIESRGEPTPALRNLVKELRLATGLHPALLSKFESALLAGGLEPARADLGPTEYDAGSSTGEVAFAVLRRQFGALLDHEGGTRLGEDPEELHDMRVATRRLRAALSLFDASLPVRAGRFRVELGWIAGALGAVRDLDVQLEQLSVLERDATTAEQGSFDPIRDLLEADLKEARASLLEALESPRYDRLVRDFTALLRQGPLRRSAASRAPVLASAPDLVTALYRKVRSAGKGLGNASAPEPYHRLRIRCKRLRYAFEFMAPVYGDPIRPLVDSLVKLQDLLGLHQDANVAAARLRTMAVELGASLPPESVFAMGAAAEASGARALRLRKRVSKARVDLGGKSWDALARTMERQRPPVPHRPSTSARTTGPTRGRDPA